MAYLSKSKNKPYHFFNLTSPSGKTLMTVSMRDDGSVYVEIARNLKLFKQFELEKE